MIKKLLTVLLMSCAMAGMSQSWHAITSDSPATVQTTLISSSTTKVSVHVRVPGFYTHEVNTPRGAAQVISVPKAVSTAEAGEPNLPVIAIPAIIDDQLHYSIRVTGSSYSDYPMEVAPSKGDFSRQIHPDDVPFTYGPAYHHDSFFPDNRVGLYEPYILRDFRGQNMVVYPFAYNPVSKTLRVYHDLTVELYSDSETGKNTLSRQSHTMKLDPEFRQLYESRFINYQAAMNRYTPVNETGHLLIICHDAFMEAMQPFVAWKKQIGIPTTMVGTSVSGFTSDALKEYVQQQYALDPEITHILLVGDNAQIQGYYAYNGGYSGRSDNWYGQLVGNDFYNDVIVGRFSAENTDHVTNQVNKVIHYERDLDATDTWLTYGTGVSTTAGNGGHFNEDDWQHVDNLRNDLLGYHYTEVYRDYQSGGGAQSSSSILSQHINAGVSIINYCNHGSETSWGVFSYSNSNVNALTNVNKLPFVWSVACLNGKYDHYQPCFAETWLRANSGNDVNQPTGAIGGMFSYISQPWVPPMYGQDEMVDILVESYENNIKRSFGGISFDGNMKIIDQYGTNNSSAMGTYMCWILFGDPTLTVRNDIPADMAVEHAPVINIAATSFEVTAANGEGARATLTLDGEILGSAVIENGSALIECEAPGETGLATLTVFGYNKITYVTTLPIVTGEDDEPVELTVSASPTVIPRGSSTNLNAQATGGNGYFVYHWTPAEELSQANIKSPVATPTVTTTYTCTVNSGSYSNMDSCVVMVVCPPTNLTATAVNNCIELHWDPANPAESYNVYKSNVLIAEGVTETTYTDSDLEPGSYSYRVATVFQGVMSPKSNASAATIFAPLSVTAAAEPAVIPQGGSTNLTATAVGGLGTCVYEWSPAATLSNPNAATTTATPTESTTYHVTVTRGGETAVAEVLVQVAIAPTNVNATLSEESSNQVELSWEAAPEADYYKVYDNNTVVLSNIEQPQCVIDNLSNGHHCFSVSAVLETVESPRSETACLDIFSCIPPDQFIATYYWEDNQFGTLLVWHKDESVNMSLNRFFIYRGVDSEHMEAIGSLVNVPFNYRYEYRDEDVEPGTYYYMIGANYGDEEECYTEPLQVEVTAVQEQSVHCLVYPNPTDGELSIESPAMQSITLVNSLGQVVYQAQVDGDKAILNPSQYGKGVYLLLIQNEKAVTTTKIVIK